MNGHDALIAAVVAVLSAAPTLAVVRDESNFDPLPDSVPRAIQVTFMGSDPEMVALSGAPIDWATKVRISCYARRDASTGGERASRALHAQVYQRLMQEPTLGGVVSFIEPPRLRADIDLLDTRIGVLHAEYLVRHRTDFASLLS